MKLRAGENRNGRSERDVATCMFLRHVDVRCCVSSHTWCRLVDMMERYIKGTKHTLS